MPKLKPNVVRGGTAIDLGNNLFLMRGRKHSGGGIDIGKNPRTGLEVEDKEVVQTSPSGLRVFSAQPILGGISPAQYILGGANPNDVFNAQEFWKKANRVTDDGKRYKIGGKVDEKTFTTKLTKKQEDKFQNWYKNVSYELGLDSNPDNPLHAYDYRGFWLENKNKDIDYKQPDFHFTDTYKKPDHPTFSVESKYADKKYGIDPKTVGHWDGENFISGSFNDLIAARTDRPIKQLEYSKQPYEPSKEIIDYIKSTEGFRDKWYQDGKGIWTVGYGFTGSKVKKLFPNGMTREQADKYFADSLNVRKQILERDTPNWDSLNQNQRDALLSYHYNIGEGKYRNSPNMQKGLEEKDWDTVSKNIDAGYNDKKNPGLRKRRDYERNLFNTPVEYKYGGKVKKEVGGDDFKTIRQRKDYIPNKFQKWIQDKIGPLYYPNPVGVHGDFSRFYFGRPTKNNTFYMSRYKPSKSKNKDTIYYGIKSPAFLNDLIHLYNNRPNINLLKSEGNQVIDGYKARTSSDLDDRYIGNNIERYFPAGDLRKKGLLPPKIGSKDYMLTDSVGALGNFTIGRGKDEKGEYLSYYDLWDVDTKTEKRGLAKPYEIYDRIYGTFDDNGRFHPNGEIEPSIISEKLKYGGIHIKPSKRGTFTAAAKKHGMSVQGFASKVLANKDKYSTKMIKKAAFAKAASKWKHKEFGGDMDFNYIIGKNNIYKLGGCKRKAPYGDELIWRPTSQDLHRPRITREDVDYGYINGVFYDRFGNPKFDTDIEPAVAIAEKPSLGLNIGIDDKRFSQYTSEELDAMRKSIVDKYKNEPVGNSLEVANPISLNNTVPNIGNGLIKSNYNTTKENKVKGNGINADLISAGINLAGNLGSYLINKNTINKMGYYGFIPLRANKLKTRFNIEPQVDNIRETVGQFEEDTNRNTASSKVALARKQQMRAKGAQFVNQLYGQKENIETQLINRDLLNQQQVANQTRARYQDWIAGLSDFNNRKLEMKAENSVAAINNVADAIAGPSGYFARKDRRLENDRLLARDLLSLELLSATNPNAAPIVDDIIKNGIDSKYYKLLKKQRSV